MDDSESQVGFADGALNAVVAADIAQGPRAVLPAALPEGRR